MANTGTKKWKHVKLVHVGGVKPLCHKVDVPVLRPGESVELVALYPPLPADHPRDIKRYASAYANIQGNKF